MQSRTDNLFKSHAFPNLHLGLQLSNKANKAIKQKKLSYVTCTFVFSQQCNDLSTSKSIQINKLHNKSDYNFLFLFPRMLFTCYNHFPQRPSRDILHYRELPLSILSIMQHCPLENISQIIHGSLLHHNFQKNHNCQMLIKLLIISHCTGFLLSSMLDITRNLLNAILEIHSTKSPFLENVYPWQ